MKERDRLIALNGKLEEVEQRWTLTCFVKGSGCSNIFDTFNFSNKRCPCAPTAQIDIGISFNPFVILVHCCYNFL